MIGLLGVLNLASGDRNQRLYSAYREIIMPSISFSNPQSMTLLLSNYYLRSSFFIASTFPRAYFNYYDKYDSSPKTFRSTIGLISHILDQSAQNSTPHLSFKNINFLLQISVMTTTQTHEGVNRTIAKPSFEILHFIATFDYLRQYTHSCM
jgi:hypothetical protein